MSEEKKDSCCSTTPSGKGCCGIQKLLVAVLIGGLCFAAGVWYSKANCGMSSKMCHMPAAGAAQ